MKILGSQQDIKERQQALAAEFMDSPQFKGQMVAMDGFLLDKGKDINDNTSVEKQPKMVSMDDVSLDLSSPEVSEVKENSLNRKRKKLNHSSGTSAEASCTSCAMCLLWAAFAIILICTVAFVIACASVYLRSPRKSNTHRNTFHLVNVFDNVTAEPTRENLLSDARTSSTLPGKSSSILSDLFKIEFKIDFNNDDETKTVPPPPSSSTTTTTTQTPTTTVRTTTMATSSTPDQPSEDPFEETLRNEIKAELDRRPSAKSSSNSDFNFKSEEKTTRRPFGTLFPFFFSSPTTTAADHNSDFIPVLKNKELTKPPSLTDLIGFVKKLLKTEELIFKANF